MTEVAPTATTTTTLTTGMTIHARNSHNDSTVMETDPPAGHNHNNKETGPAVITMTMSTIIQTAHPNDTTISPTTGDKEVKWDLVGVVLVLVATIAGWVILRYTKIGVEKERIVADGEKAKGIIEMEKEKAKGDIEVQMERVREGI
ncbi:hypothetical protein BGX38DRAFT_1329174 [Terfezia claveryi]|nr:hypothetical protein BGX38DRAFT_1329174 [Terfezia claveryi]